MIGISTILAAHSLKQEPTVVHVDVTKPTINVSPYLYGIFFEEINCSGDGGIYAELVRNRSFEESPEPKFWKLESIGGPGKLAVIKNTDGGEENTQCLSWSGEGKLINEGYWGMAVRRGQPYDLSASFKPVGGGDRTFAISLETAAGVPLATQNVKVKAGSAWETIKTTLKPSRDDSTARMSIRETTGGEVLVDMVSLFPRDTFNGRKNGLRKDLAYLLKDIKPAFMRFPGGCWVEGETMATSMKWKKTIGPIANRRTQPNLWQYISPNGLGYHEYLQMCEDLGAAPLFVINCGMSHKEVAPLGQMDEYVQDALDAIEYANGPATSKWGAVRAAAGHPKPFGLKFMEIGNENGGPNYAPRYKMIYEAVHKAYPEIGLVADVWGGVPTSAPVDIIDEHYYSNPNFFFANANRYDTYDRKGPKVYVGEYAVTEGCGGGNLIAAVSEAAFMCGMERNADQVIMASYAPLFANVNYKKWNPDLINFNSGQAYGTPSYYVQQLFAHNRADQVLSTTLQNDREVVTPFPQGSAGVGTWKTQAEYKDLKVTIGKKVVAASATGEGLKKEGGEWKNTADTIQQLSSGDGTRAMLNGNFGDTYTVSVKGRKLGGEEGFLVHFGVESYDNFLWLNVGGWQNSRIALELGKNGAKQVVSEKQFKIETGRWYDLKVDVNPKEIRCYVDGKQILVAKTPSHRFIHVVSGKSKSTGDVIVKVVNGDSVARPTVIDLDGLKGAVRGTVETLTSTSPNDENSIENPKKVQPTKGTVSSTTNKLSVTLPACSVSIFRIKSGN